MKKTNFELRTFPLSVLNFSHLINPLEFDLPSGILFFREGYLFVPCLKESMPGHRLTGNLPSLQLIEVALTINMIIKGRQ